MRQAGATETLPLVRYLGQGGAYAVNPGENFIVKRIHPFRFDFEPGPTYVAQANERVWASSGETDIPPADYHNWHTFGTVEAGCVIDYVGIDDDVNGIVNSFYINGEVVHTITEGLVFDGRFTTPIDGELQLYASDSVGIWVNICEDQIELTPSATATETPTATATTTNTPTPTPTDEPTITPSVTLTPSVTPTGTLTATTTATPTPSLTPSLTPTNDVTPTVTATPDVPETTPTPTREPRLNACLRINFEIGGHVARTGLYVVQEVGGRVLASWYADEGWEDSGWITEIDISYPAVYVQVLYYAGPDTEPIVMRILNPAPGTQYGWLSRGMCHALEVAWP